MGMSWNESIDLDEVTGKEQGNEPELHLAGSFSGVEEAGHESIKEQLLLELPAHHMKLS